MHLATGGRVQDWRVAKKGKRPAEDNSRIGNRAQRQADRVLVQTRNSELLGSLRCFICFTCLVTPTIWSTVNRTSTSSRGSLYSSSGQPNTFYYTLTSFTYSPSSSVAVGWNPIHDMSMPRTISSSTLTTTFFLSSAPGIYEHNGSARPSISQLPNSTSSLPASTTTFRNSNSHSALPSLSQLHT